MNKKPAILFVVHKGKLESQALLLAASLRFYNGDNYDLIACIPTQSGGIASGISESVRSHLDQLNIQYVEVENPIGSEYLIGNKLNCLSATNHHNRTFLDTDMICISPLQLPRLKDHEIAVKPADRKTYGWSDQQWKAAYLRYADYELTEQDQLMSTCFRELMWPYFNAGLIHISGCPEFSQTWSNISKELDADTAFQNKRPWLDQLSLPLAIKKLKLKILGLTEAFNFPANIKAITNQQISLVHYHRPEHISANRLLLSQVSEMVQHHDWLLPALSQADEWSEVLTGLKKMNMSDKKPANEYLLTEIPFSGVDEICASLKNTQGVEVFNNPVEVSKPISRRYIPWGMGLFFEQQQTHFKCSVGTSELVVSLDLALLTSISRVRQVKPHAVIVACINDPLETVYSWTADSIQALIESDTLSYNMKFLSEPDKQLFAQLMTCESETMKKALFWCFCANQLLNNPDVKLIHANEQLNDMKSLLNNKFSIGTGFLADITPNSNVGLNADEVSIRNITNPVYSDLLGVMHNQRTVY